MNYIECEHLTSLELIDLGAPLFRTEDTDAVKSIQAKGKAHEGDFSEHLKLQNDRIVDVVLLYPHHAEPENHTVVRIFYKLNPWTNSDESEAKQIRVAIIDLSEFSTIQTQLNN